MPIFKLNKLPDVNSAEKTKEINNSDPEINKLFNKELTKL